MKVEIIERFSRGGFTYSPGVREVAADVADWALANGKAIIVKEVAIKKTRTKKAVEPDADCRDI